MTILMTNIATFVTVNTIYCIYNVSALNCYISFLISTSSSIVHDFISVIKKAILIWRIFSVTMCIYIKLFYLD